MQNQQRQKAQSPSSTGSTATQISSLDLDHEKKEKETASKRDIGVVVPRAQEFPRAQEQGLVGGVLVAGGLRVYEPSGLRERGGRGGGRGNGLYIPTGSFIRGVEVGVGVGVGTDLEEVMRLRSHTPVGCDGDGEGEGEGANNEDEGDKNGNDEIGEIAMPKTPVLRASRSRRGRREVGGDMIPLAEVTLQNPKEAQPHQQIQTHPFLQNGKTSHNEEQKPRLPTSKRHASQTAATTINNNTQNVTLPAPSETQAQIDERKIMREGIRRENVRRLEEAKVCMGLGFEWMLGGEHVNVRREQLLGPLGVLRIEEWADGCEMLECQGWPVLGD